ncbi:hypothetical protein [Streptomyces rimosus]|uniref:hypothetical protein n=1 Tax=Streptomyces rimosus TaxID=1927 RepID=UPI0004BF9B76|nr:hypothetical protein [Streptomyces rimosus]
MTTDYEQLRQKAQDEVNEELASVKDPFERRAAAEEIRDQAHMELSALKEERKELIASAALYEYTPQLHERFGIKRLQMKRLAMDVLRGLKGRENWISPPSWPADRAKAARRAGIPHPDNVVEQAEKIAARYEYAEARRDAAVTHLEAAHEAVRLAGGRVKVPALERRNFDAVRKRARNKVMRQFAKLIVGPEELLRAAAEAVDRAEEDAADLLVERDAAMNSLSFYTTARGVYYSAGISRQGLVRAQQRALKLKRDEKVPPRAEQPAAARRAGVKFIEDADKKLPKLASAYEAAVARHAAAIEIRDEAVRALHAAPHAWSRSQLAEAIGRDHKIVARIVNPDRTS